MLWDTHIHSDFSHDGKASMEEMINAAKRRKLSGICFTEHLDIKSIENGVDFPLALNRYMETCCKLSAMEKFPVRMGIEFSIMPELAPYLQQLADANAFDFIIGSCHHVERSILETEGIEPAKAEEQMYTEHFCTMLEAIKNVDSFDVCGHIDYVVRYGPNQNRYYSYEKYADIIDEILQTLIMRGKGIEINTSGFRYGLGQSHPNEAILKRYKELGGEIITIGSDGHAPEQIAYAFEKVPDILQKAGFKYFTVFKERKPIFYKLK